MEEELNDVRIKQISTSDPDSRQMIMRNNITEVAYNVQTTVDSTNNLLIDYEVTNTNEKKAMVERAVGIIGHTEMTILYDKGYHTGSEFSKAEAVGVDVLVAIPGVPLASQAPDPKYNRSEFEYNEEEDSYRCPEGQILTAAPSTYTHRNSSRPDYKYTFKKYRTTACRQCPVKTQCTRSKTNVRHIDRTEHTGAIDRNKERIENSENYYKRRQAIVEHPYEDILVSDLSEIKGRKPTFKRKESNHQIRVGCKRQWRFDHIMTKRKIECASSDVGLMMSAYNPRRLFNLLEFRDLANYLNEILENLNKNIVLMAQRLIKHQGIKLYFRYLIMNGRITRRNKHILGISF